MVDRRRATIFGSEAERYDQFRPSYPAQVIDRVVQGQPRDAVDIGCGTGKAAKLVADRGVAVVGVEPDQKMAAVARRHGVDVTVSTLEGWDVAACDLMYAAQAWHWVDPVRGADVAAASIRPGGRWAAFWNYETDAAFSAARNTIYQQLAPELLDQQVSGDDDEFRATIADGLAATGAFGEMMVDEVTWVDRVTVAHAVERLASHSHHRLLEPSISTAFNNALQRELGAPNDLLSLSYTTQIFTADRR